MIKKMVKAHSFCLIKIGIWVLGNMTKEMVKAHSFG